MNSKKPFLNFQVDHMTLLLQPELYKVAYVIFGVIFGVELDDKKDRLYEKRKQWSKDEGEQSMTFAVRIGQGANSDDSLNNAIIAVVQPSEPKTQDSHVRDMLDDHSAAAHWQHIALRTSDLVAFHKHAIERGVQFITPILKDGLGEDLIQVFSGEWFFPGTKPSGMFFEFVQRKPSAQLLQAIEKDSGKTWFRDETFLGLYAEKQREYDSGDVTPFISFELFDLLLEKFLDKQIWEITETDIAEAEKLMIEHTQDSMSSS